MAIGIITGTGTDALPGFEDPEALTVGTPFGETLVNRGKYAGVDALHVSKHGRHHIRLSNQINYRANVWALKQLGATAVVACTACGAVDPSLTLGSLVVFDDLHFPANRLPDGSLCTYFVWPGDPLRGHWILHGGPFSEELRVALRDAAASAGHELRDRGVYGHVDGPRFNTPVEIAQLRSCGVTAVSQTGGPPTVLCGELELPFALVGYVTDYANEVRKDEPTPVETLTELIGRSSPVFADVLHGALPRIARDSPSAAGTVYRIEQA